MAASSSLTLPKFLTSLLPSSSSSSPSPPPPSFVSLPKSTASVPATTLGLTSCIAAVAFPSLAHSNTLFFKSAYNVQVIAEENEPEERLLNRFRKEVFKAGVLRECRRRRFFENSQDKRKRKSREAARRNRKRPPQPKAPTKAKQETINTKNDEKDDNWDHFDVDLPY
ncbi:30S ribosomal protein S21 [Morus notabilis]|uniref:30S ribosomal protein S21 n=1 Tax=Morus notabilis TaxID=981085 RepID=W9RJT4_9ROSA|nr:30S ribosomal protein S21, chloroplastic [Morus notabilis]XP_024025555.1 30S ribosomal protein S21, chloroplastic [Morus notabilis]XP_024025556.1 30S ribosomal protein S21, chloroplastic [Morus notabilis]EXB94322.1 30S ribosomal protein S21 [Morus notabilis]